MGSFHFLQIAIWLPARQSVVISVPGLTGLDSLTGGENPEQATSQTAATDDRMIFNL